MKTNHLIKLLILMMVLGMLLAMTGSFDAVMMIAFPFAQIGLALRWLSLSGQAGNVVAIILYVLLSLSPLVLLFLLYKQRKMIKVDALLVLLSGALFPLLYLFINPRLIHNLGTPGALSLPTEFAMGMAGSVLHSITLTYLVLRLLHALFQSNGKQLIRYMKVFLVAGINISVFFVFGLAFRHLWNRFAGFRSGEHWNGQSLTGNHLFSIIEFGMGVMPILLTIWVTVIVLEMLTSFEKGYYTDQSVELATCLVKRCKTAIAVVILLQLAFNLSQFFLFPWIDHVNFLITIPLYSVVFLVLILLIARFIEEGKKLKEEQELFV